MYRAWHPSCVAPVMAGAVLVVDDDVTLAQSLRETLASEDVTIEGATDAATACALLDERRFCGLILDLVLEDSNGFEVLRYLERTRIAIPTIVVTQKLPSYVREMLTEEQVKLVFPKPVDPRLLGAVVMGMCGIAN
ncbi:MAG TPA: response regulator [Thermoanaerobaculia bacterium]